MSISSLSDLLCSITLTHPLGFVFHFALMQNETKDQAYASLPDPLRTRKLKQKKTFNADILLFLNAFIRPAGTPCNRQGREA